MMTEQQDATPLWTDERATLTARIAELEAQLAETERMVSLETIQAVEIGTLRAQLAQAQAGQNEAIATLKLVYRKHHLGDDSIGWDELSDKVLDTLSNLMGVDELVRWQEGSDHA